MPRAPAPALVLLDAHSVDASGRFGSACLPGALRIPPAPPVAVVITRARTPVLPAVRFLSGSHAAFCLVSALVPRLPPACGLLTTFARVATGAAAPRLFLGHCCGWDLHILLPACTALLRLTPYYCAPANTPPAPFSFCGLRFSCAGPAGLHSCARTAFCWFCRLLMPRAPPRLLLLCLPPTCWFTARCHLLAHARAAHRRCCGFLRALPAAHAKRVTLCAQTVPHCRSALGPNSACSFACSSGSCLHIIYAFFCACRHHFYLRFSFHARALYTTTRVVGTLFAA